MRLPLSASLLAVLLTTAFVPAAHAAPITFTYSTTFDMTSIGLGAAEPFSLRYTFDPDVVTTAPDFVNGTAYSPVQIDRVQVATTVANAPAVDVSVINVANDSFLVNDRYRVFVQFPTAGLAFDGGNTLSSLEVAFADASQNLFSDDSLPTTVDFAFEPNVEDLSALATNNGFLLDSGPFTFVPEPSSLVLLGAAGVSLLRRRRSQPAPSQR